MFKEYWNKPEATRTAFTNDGWFKTGDIAQINEGYYKIIGRSSIDIIKSGGYKLSALEIEEVLRSYPGIRDCGVVGIPDEEWGEGVAAAIVLKAGATASAEELQDWVRKHLRSSRVPQLLRFEAELPYNETGKLLRRKVRESLGAA